MIKIATKFNFKVSNLQNISLGYVPDHWGPFYVMDQQAIERVQCRATKIIPELRHYSYQEHLQRLSLPSLFIGG